MEVIDGYEKLMEFNARYDTNFRMGLANVATDKTKNDINAEKPSATTPPAVEKSYPNSTDKVATGAHVEITRLLTTSSPTKTHPSVEPTSKSSTTTSPVHFVGGWKAPSPTKEISREDRKSLEDDNEDLTLLERVSSKDDNILWLTETKNEFFGL